MPIVQGGKLAISSGNAVRGTLGLTRQEYHFYQHHEQQRHF